MSTTTAIRTQEFPRVNLLPSEIAEEQRFRSLRAVLALAVVAAVAGVGGLWYLAHNQVSAAEEGLATAQATNVTLQAEAAKYADVPKVYAQVAAANTALDLAMGHEVRYSFVLNDLSLTIPSDIALTSVTVVQDVDAAAQTSALGKPAIGTVTVQGNAYRHNNVAAWLSSLTKSKYYQDPYFTSSTLNEASDGGTSLVEFDSSVSMTDKAYSNRYTTKSGG